jgi:HORMA domain-containing protein
LTGTSEDKELWEPPLIPYTHAFSRAHSILFLSDNLRNTLREVVRENGLDPNKLMQDWETIERGIRVWLEDGDLNNIVIEVFKPGSSTAAARWEFPIGYNGSGVEDDLWLDKFYLRQLIAKSARPTTDCNYRILLCTAPGAKSVPGFVSCRFLSTGQLAARQAGTVIATAHMTAGATYWR